MSTRIPDLRSHTVAWFRSSADVRAAESALERSGIEAKYIEVARPSARRNRREIDRKTWKNMGRRGLVGVVVGIAIGALVGFLLGLVFGADGVELFAWAMAGAIPGAPLGAIYMVGTRLPVQEQTFDTYGSTPDVEEWIAVSGPEDVQTEAARILHDQNPVRLDGVAA
jgi:hypothetical protein